MKKWLLGFWVVLAVMVLAGPPAMAEMVSAVVEEDAAEGTWTPAIEVGKSSFLGEDSTRSLGIFISGSSGFSATVGLQYSVDGGDWEDLYVGGTRVTWTGPTHETLTDYMPGIRYRAGCATGDYAFGTVNVGLGK